MISKKNHMGSFAAVLFCFIFPFNNFAQQIKESKVPKFAVCDIIIENSEIPKGKSIQFNIYTEVNTLYSKETVCYSNKLVKNITRFKIPLSSDFMYGRISDPNDPSNKLFNWGNNLYIFEAGDTVQIHIDKEKIRFEGKSKDKFACMNRLHGLRIWSFSNADELWADKQYDKSILAAKFTADSALNVAKGILNEYKDKMHAKIYDLLLLDIRPIFEQPFFGKLIGLSNSPFRSEFFEKSKEQIAFYFGKPYNEKTDPLVVTQSYMFCDMLFDREVEKVQLFKSKIEGDVNLTHTFEEVFASINKNYTGIIRDKLHVINWLSNGNSKVYSPELIKEAMKSAGENQFKNSLKKISARSVGSDAFDFQFSDRNGKNYSLKDFKGKVIVMDFWFTGCSGCAYLAKTVGPIAESYKSNPNVVFVTVSTDLKRDSWVKSLDGGAYTSDSEINLFTNGLAREDPFVKHYNINYFPHLMIISKDGKIISTNPPKPYAEVEGSTEAFKALIDKNL